MSWVGERVARDREVGAARSFWVCRRSALALPLLFAIVFAQALAATPVAAASRALAGASRMTPGARWQLQATPSPGQSAALLGISCVTASSCQAVGSVSAQGSTQPLAEFWNGVGWRTEKAGAVSGAYSASLYSVACANASLCMAVGSVELGSGHGTLAELWNGRGWTVVPTPATTESALESVACPMASLCIAVGVKSGAQAGVPLVDVWNGSKWSQANAAVPSNWPNSGLYSISCPSSHSCYAVGMYQNQSFTTQNLVEGWSGARWTVLPAPNVSAQGDILDGIACGSTQSCLAVGSSTTSVSGQYAPISVAMRGSGWSMGASQPQSAPGASSSPQGVSCTGSSACTLVGNANASPGHVSMAESWNGSSWLAQAVAPASGMNSFAGVSCAGTSCVAVGSAAGRTLSERYGF